MNQFCECDKDGYCARYRKYMGGRMRDICAGVNVDLGTAAAFREQWRRETCAPTPVGTNKEALLLKTDQAPGDALVMTAAIYSLHVAHPGKYLTAVESAYPEIFAHNPNVVPASSVPHAKSIHMHYPAIHTSNKRGIHFMQGWCEFLGMALGISIPLMTNKPMLYFTDLKPSELYGYWVVCSGTKNDFTAKAWGHHNYQRVVSSLKDMVGFTQVGSATDCHYELKGAVNMLGRTTLRELFDLVRYSRGVLCGVSLLMHVAAALDKPAVIIAGGREPVQWNSYPKQHYLHTVGLLPCRPVYESAGGVGDACWRSRVVPMRDRTLSDLEICQRPVDGLPECMEMIWPEAVSNLILSCQMSAVGKE